MPNADANRPLRHSQRLLGNYIGVNDANNEIVTDAIAANRDGSLLERLEDLRNVGDGTTVPVGLPASFHPILGYRVTKAATVASAPDALFDVTGMCEITRMIGEVTSAIATSTSMSLNTSTNDQVIVASTQVTTDAIGTLYGVSGDPDLAFNAALAPGIDAILYKDGHVAPFIVNDDQIEQNVDGAGTGLVTWSLWYWPLEASAAVVAAA